MKKLKHFWRDERGGVLATEYILFVAAIGIILVVGVAVLFGGLSALVGAYAGYFSKGSSGGGGSVGG